MQQLQHTSKMVLYMESCPSGEPVQGTKSSKRLVLFFIAANALMLAGQLLDTDRSWLQFLLLQWCGITGVYMIYRFNDLIDHSADFRFNLRRVLSNRLHVACLLQFVCITLPAIFLLLSELRIVLLLSTCFLGLLYSVNVRLHGRNYRIKHLFLVKNLLIGTLWGSTILIGANTLGSELVIGLFVFTSIQVMTGSIIRDVPDTETDRREGVRTLPVVLGIPRTVVLLHAFNLLSLAAGWLLFPDSGFLLLMLLVVGWRALVVFRFARNPHHPFYSNTLNLLTCPLIFIILFIQHNGF